MLELLQRSKYLALFNFIMKIPISNKILDDFVLKNHEYLVDRNYYDNKSGEQEYRLYSYLTTLFNNTTILDIGTNYGRNPCW